MQANNTTTTEDLLHQLSTSPIPVENTELAAARRDRVVAHLAGLVPSVHAARQRTQRRIARLTMLSAAAALALTTGWVALRAQRRPSASASDQAPSTVVALNGSVQLIHHAAQVVAPPLERMPVGDADEVVTGEGASARALLANGTEVDIDARTRFRVRADGVAGRPASTPAHREGESVVLDAGRVTLRVPRLGPARSLAVETPEATIVVHGTAFSVTRTLPAAGSPRTTVDVTEGTVAVHSRRTEVLLHGGDHWASDSLVDRELDSSVSVEPPPSAPERVGGQRKTSASPVRAGNGSTRTPTPPATSDKSSSLAAENRLLQAAMAARQQGDAPGAVQLAGELLARFPNSPLAEEARVERMRALLAGGNPAAAAAEARSYLSDYPQGFARQEASRVLGGPIH